MKSKIDTNTVKNFSTALVAGMCIGFGVIISLTIEDSVASSLFFAFGLLVIVALGLPLYTGRIGFMKEPKTFPSILIANLCGVVGLITIYVFSKPEFLITLRTVSLIKYQKNIFQMLCCGILCGILIHFAVKIKSIPVTFLAIAIFILIGAEHCIADFPYLLVNFNLINLIKWAIIIVGNSIGAIAIEILTTEKINEICKHFTK